MLKIFRKIREDMLTKKSTPGAPIKMSSYFKYAIGEIILVVIGILIALQINDWNQQRIDNVNQKKMLANLRQEFIQNKMLLDKSRLVNEGSLNAGIIIMNLMGSEKEDLQKHNLDSLFYISLSSDEYLPSSNAIEDIIQSGRMNLLNDPELSTLLSSWKSIINVLIDRDETLDNWIQREMLPYLNKTISIKEMDSYGKFKWTGKSQLKKDYTSIFYDLEFENILENMLYFYQQNKIRYDEANTILNQLIDKTSEY